MPREALPIMLDLILPGDNAFEGHCVIMPEFEIIRRFGMIASIPRYVSPRRAFIYRVSEFHYPLAFVIAFSSAIAHLSSVGSLSKA